MSTEVTSNGSRRLRNNTRLRSPVVTRKSPSRAEPRVFVQREKDGGEHSKKCQDAGNANQIGSTTPVCAFFLASIQQHDDENKKHHDGAGVDDDLRESKKLRAEQQVEHGERGHDHDQRQERC